MEKIILSNEQINNLKLFSSGEEAKLYLYIENGEKKLIKIFRNEQFIDKKMKKIAIIKERTKKCDFVVKADKQVINNNKTIGYSMPLINGEEFCFLDRSLAKNIIILKDLSNKLKKLHNLGIVCADFHHNFLIDKKNNIYLIDCDNFAIDHLGVDLYNMYLITYRATGKKIDKNFDDYLLNLFAISIITNIYTPYLYEQYEKNPHLFNFKDDKINEIIRKTFVLEKIYNEELIIDQINSKKDLKKIKVKKF